MTSTHRLTALVCLLLAAAAAPACAVETADDSDDALGASEDELATMSYYTCTSGNRDSNVQSLELGIGASKISVTDLSKDAMVPDTGTLVSNYRPTSATYQGGAMYSNFKKLQAEMHQNVDFILSKELKAKAAAAKLYLRTQDGEGGGTQSFWCKSKPKRLTVNTNQMGRFACSLQPGLAIAGGPPPGETQLYDLFMFQQQTDYSNLSLTYLDHFGVNVRERKETLTSVDAFHRTTKKLTGTWGKNKMDLTYRAGITYTGTFKYQDGQSTKVMCNDLSMLDTPR